jgi:hypothetical protein
MKSNGYIWLAKLYLEVKIFTQQSVGNRRRRADEIATAAVREKKKKKRNCHGGGLAGRFQLLPPAKLAERRRCSTEEKEKVHEVKYRTYIQLKQKTSKIRRRIYLCIYVYLVCVQFVAACDQL